MVQFLAVLLCVSIGTITVSGDCLNGWIHFDDSCYKLFKDKKIWPEAEYACKTHDSYLVEIDTALETSYLHAHLKGLSLNENDSIWISLTDFRHEGLYQWERFEKNATYFNWAPTEPNGNQGHNKDEDCVFLFGKHDYGWADADCARTHFYMCERASNAAPVS